MKITITEREFKQFYIDNYFYNHKRIIRYMRMYLGPIMLVVGLFLYISYKQEVNAFFIAFLLAYGAIYIVKPFLMMSVNRYKDETFTYDISDGKLYIKDRLKKGEIDLNENKMQENKKYFFVKLETGQKIFFPKEKINDSIIELFREHK